MLSGAVRPRPAVPGPVPSPGCGQARAARYVVLAPCVGRPADVCRDRDGRGVRDRVRWCGRSVAGACTAPFCSECGPPSFGGHSVPGSAVADSTALVKTPIPPLNSRATAHSGPEKPGYPRDSRLFLALGENNSRRGRSLLRVRSFLVRARIVLGHRRRYRGPAQGMLWSVARGDRWSLLAPGCAAPRRRSGQAVAARDCDWGGARHVLAGGSRLVLT